MILKTRLLAGAVLALTLSSAAAVAQTAKPWIHVEVRENGDSTEKVNVNVPLSLARVALSAVQPKIEHKIADGLRNGLEKGEMSLADIRSMWAELRASGDAELVSVDDKDQTVRIARDGAHIRVRVESKKEAGESVRVDVPITVVDALFSGDGDELNLPAAIQQLEAMRGDIVNVVDKDSTVRVWIDERS
ncbi:MAG: hypothetical protein GC160_22370 [Acidobacteria bacterium]|nr:hypothetical protein [Acidobacteriota bacterium]